MASSTIPIPAVAYVNQGAAGRRSNAIENAIATKPSAGQIAHDVWKEKIASTGIVQ
jgi:hypothetical protein